MWVVEPTISGSKPVVAVVPICKILRAAHLIPVYHEQGIPDGLEPSGTLDHFTKFYVNKYIDYHAFELAV